MCAHTLPSHLSHESANPGNLTSPTFAVDSCALPNSFFDPAMDLRFALRTLRKTPAFTALSIVTIALGVGANTAAFSMVRGVLLRRLPYAADSRLVRIKQPSANEPDSRFSVLEIAGFRAQTKSLARTGEYHSMPFQLYGRGDPQPAQTAAVSA